MSIAQEVEKAIGVAEAASGVEAGFAARVWAIEQLEVHAIDRLRYLKEAGGLPAELREVGGRAKRLRRRLEAANQWELRRLRQWIRSGGARPEELRGVLIRQGGPPGSQGRYDALDVLVGGLLRAGGLGAERVAREPEMVAYQPTPARAILSLIERAKLGPGELLYDLGSGLGHVVILVALLSGARARGIELEPAYCEYAERCARRLKVPGVEFVQGDAREAPLAEGTVYFMFTPFRGALLQRVLERLCAEATARPIRVCTFGPCTAEVAARAATWLRPEDARVPGEHEVAIFRSAQ